MGWLDSILAAKNSVANKVKQFQNSGFLDRTMAMCAMVSYADGSLDPKEKQKVLKFIETNELLACFDRSQKQTSFSYWFDKFEKDSDFATLDAETAISKIKGNTEEAETLIRVGCIIGGADGNFDDQEKDVVRRVCKLTNVPEQSFNL